MTELEERPWGAGDELRESSKLKSMRLRSAALYSSKIIKAGALIGDTKTMLSHWDVDASVDENISEFSAKLCKEGGSG
jgi:hypothetical protein